MSYNKMLRCIGLFVANAVPISAMTADVDPVFIPGVSFFV